MPIRAPKSKLSYKSKTCVTCKHSYQTRYEHNTVTKCKIWDNKVVTCGEHCNKYEQKGS